MESKKKILVLIPHYLPGYKLGGPLVSISNIINNLSKDFNFMVLTLDRDFGDTRPYNEIKTNTWLDKKNHEICYIPKNMFTVVNLIKKINKTPHDVLYLNSFFDPVFSIVMIVANKIGLLKTKNIIVAPRGEAYDEALNFKKRKKSIYLWFAKKFKLYDNIVFHASTEHEKRLISKNMGIKPTSIKVAINMAELEDNTEHNKIDLVVKQKNSLNIVFLSRISKDKNISYTFYILNNIKENIIFDIYGPIEDKDIWQSCQEKIKKLPPNIKVTYKGSIDRKDVKKTLGRYDLMFLPTFAENYGHVIVESLLSGTPVLISDNTPWRSLEADGLGWDISLESPDLYIDAINSMASDRNSTHLKSRNDIAASFRKRLSDPSIYNANKALFDLPLLGK